MIVNCPSCGRPATLPDDRAGRRFACPHCRAVLPDNAAPARAVAVDEARPNLSAVGRASPPVHYSTITAPGAVSSLVCGIVAVLTAWSFCLATVLAIIAILQGGAALDAIRRYPEKYSGRGMALAGRILGIAVLVLYLLGVCLLVIGAWVL